MTDNTPNAYFALVISKFTHSVGARAFTVTLGIACMQSRQTIYIFFRTMVYDPHASHMPSRDSPYPTLCPRI